jgi:hypothetical protein
MRLQFLAIPLLAAAAFAAPQAETTTYVDGNLTGVSPNSGATLTFTGDKEMVLRTGLTNVAVPFESIGHAELGAVKETSHDVPFYKIWAHHHAKTQTQLLVVNFKNSEGEDKTMTLELAQPAAASVFSSIESHRAAPQQVASAEVPAPQPDASAAPAPAAAEQPAPKSKRIKLQPKPDAKADSTKPVESTDWWGDTWWKTTRNTDKWGKPTSTNAPDQQ